MCRCCGGAMDPSFTTRDFNRRVSAIQFRYDRCRRCGTYSLANPPDDLERYYPATYYGVLDEEALTSEMWRVNAQLAPVLARLDGGSITEVGAHNGALLHAAQRHGFADCIAIERDERSCKFMRSLGIDARETADPVAGLSAAPATDAVVMHHVIEHVPDPMGLLDAAAANVKPGGVLVVAAPNPRSLSFRVCGPRWMHVDAPRHLHLLPVEVISDRVRRSGMRKVGASDRDPVSMFWSWAAWNPWAAHLSRGHPRVADRLARAVRAVAEPIEKRGLRGACYMAVYERPAGQRGDGAPSAETA